MPPINNPRPTSLPPQGVPPRNPHSGFGFSPSFSNSNVSKPVHFDWDQVENIIASNRKHVGTVPLLEGSGKGIHVPASWANQRGYFNDPENPGQTYFQTNPEFKTFFPYEPDYSALASINKWKETGGGIYDLKPYLEKEYENEPNFKYIPTQHPLGLYRPDTKDIHLNMLLGEDHDILNTLKHELKHHWTLDPDGEVVEGPVGTSWEESLVDQFDTDFNDPLHPEIHMMDMMWDIPDDMQTDFLWFPWDDTTKYSQNLGKMHRMGKREYLGLN
mgnify:CR=1 FL=1